MGWLRRWWPAVAGVVALVATSWLIGKGALGADIATIVSLDVAIASLAVGVLALRPKDNRTDSVRSSRAPDPAPPTTPIWSAPKRRSNRRLLTRVSWRSSA